MEPGSDKNPIFWSIIKGVLIMRWGGGKEALINNFVTILSERLSVEQFTNHVSIKKNGFIWEFFPNSGPHPPFGNLLFKKNTLGLILRFRP